MKVTKCFKAVCCDMIIDHFLPLCSARVSVIDIVPQYRQIRIFFNYISWIMK